MLMRFTTGKRGYQLRLERDLLGDLVMTRYWFGLKNNRHGSCMQVFLDEEDAHRQFERVVRMRLRNGYEICE